MKCTFVVRFGPQTDAAARRFEGRVEEVDTGKELRFRSQAELLKFFSQRLLALVDAETESGRTTKRRRVEP